jgi:hypothetical protein
MPPDGTYAAPEPPPPTPTPAPYDQGPPPPNPEPAARERAAAARQHHVPDFAFELTPYVWLPTAVKRSRTSVGGQATSVNADAGETFDDFRLSSGLRLEGWSSHFGLVIDTSWLHLSRNDTIGGNAVDWYSNQFIGDFLGGFKLFTVRSRSAAQSFSIALTGGVRVTYNKQNLMIDQALTTGSDWFAKANLGGQIPIQLAEHFGLKFIGNVRVPDVGWTLAGLIRLQAAPFTVDMGYRFDRFNYQSGGNRLGVDTHSVYLGLGFRADPRLFLN